MFGLFYLAYYYWVDLEMTGLDVVRGNGEPRGERRLGVDWFGLLGAISVKLGV